MGTIRTRRAKSPPWPTIIDANACIIAVADVRGRTVYVNRAFATVTGWTPREMPGRKLTLPAPARAALRRGQSWTGEIRNRREDGTFYWEHAVLSPIPGGGFIKIARDITASRQARANHARRLGALRRSALLDPLTGVLNRRGLAAELARHRTDRLGVLMLDLDQLKRINDRHGHATGDAVLQELARRLKEGIRPTDLVARIGGDEFAVLAPGAGLRETKTIARRLLNKVNGDAFRIRSLVICARVSIGAAAVRGTAGEFLGSADRALLQAKRRGRARACFAPAQQ